VEQIYLLQSFAAETFTEYVTLYFSSILGLFASFYTFAYSFYPLRRCPLRAWVSQVSGA
jgi:hypothetical protein